jgi:hypothetical protein
MSEVSSAAPAAPTTAPSAPQNAKAPSEGQTPPNTPYNTQNGAQNSHNNTSNEVQKPIKKKYQYKADGQDVAEELDDSEIANRLSLAKAAQKRMMEAGQTKKQAEEFFKRLKENPLDILGDDRVMGKQKFREIAEKYLIEQMQLEQMTPEERARLDKDNKLNEYERQERERAEQEQKRQAQQQEQIWAERYEKTIIDTLEKTKLPKNPRTIARMAQAMQTALKHGIDADSTLLAEMVTGDYKNELTSIIGESGPEQLIAMFGEDIINKIRRYDLQRYSAKNPEPVKTTQQSSTPRQVSQPISSREFTESLRAKFQK